MRLINEDNISNQSFLFRKYIKQHETTQNQLPILQLINNTDLFWLVIRTFYFLIRSEIKNLFFFSKRKTDPTACLPKK